MRQNIALFDFDGTLVDSKMAIVTAYRTAIQKVMNIQLEPDDEHVQEVLRRRPAEYLAQHYGHYANELVQVYQASYSSDSINLYPGVTSLLDHLDAVGVRYGIVTNKGRDRVLLDIDKLELDRNRFALILTAEDCALRKPDPSSILLALTQLNASTTTASYVGDGPHDVAAAKASGVQAVAVTWGYYPENQLRSEKPDAVCRSVAELKTVLSRGC